MTNPGTIRWKKVPSKKPLLASATSEPHAFGDCLGSSATLKSPQLVLKVSVTLALGSSGEGFFCLPGCWACGAATSWQPPAVVVACCGCVALVRASFALVVDDESP